MGSIRQRLIISLIACLCGPPPGGLPAVFSRSVCVFSPSRFGVPVNDVPCGAPCVGVFAHCCTRAQQTEVIRAKMLEASLSLLSGLRFCEFERSEPHFLKTI